MSAFQQGKLHINHWAELSASIGIAEQVGAIGTSALLKALKNGETAFLPLSRDTSSHTWKQWAARTRHRAAVALLGDDDHIVLGPTSWPLARRAADWANAALLHAAGAERWHYELAIQKARAVGKVLIVECASATADAWLDLLTVSLPPRNILSIVPIDGPHPRPLSKAALQ